MNNPENYKKIKCCANCKSVRKFYLSRQFDKNYECMFFAKDEDDGVEVESDYCCDLHKKEDE